MERFYQAIDKRCSIRSYKSSLSPRDKKSLQDFANSISAHDVRIAIGTSNKIFAKQLFQKGITGTDCFAAIISANGRDVYSGYLGELFMLECTARGIGTCWLGSSFKKNAALAAVELDEDETLVCVTPLGIPNEEFKRRQRNSISELTNLSVREFQALPKWQQYAVECARRAPSAMNRQPWAIEIYEDSIGIVNTSWNYGFGILDCGIAMLHTELGAAHYGVSGEWNLDKSDEAVFIVKGALPRKTSAIDETDNDEQLYDAAEDGMEEYVFVDEDIRRPYKPTNRNSVDDVDGERDDNENEFGVDDTYESLDCIDDMVDIGDVDEYEEFYDYTIRDNAPYIDADPDE